MLSQIIFIPSMLVGGVMLPYDFLPTGAQMLARIFPPTHAMNAILFAGGILAFWLAIYLFNWDRQNQTRRGHPALAAIALLPWLASLLLA